MTADEYEDDIWELACFLKELRQVAGLRRTDRWLLSMDNDSAHAAANLAGLNIWPANARFTCPPLSPDIHKAVEHVHGYLGGAMHSWRRHMLPNKPSHADCMKHLEELFMSYPPAAIQADIESLPETYQAIIDAAGMYPPKPYR